MAEECEKVQVTLSGKNHFQVLCDGLQQFLNDECMVDINVVCHDKYLKVHRLILAIFSPILKNSLLASAAASNDLSKESIEQHHHNQRQSHTSSHLPAVDHDTLNLDYVTDQGNYVQYLIEFLYQGKVTLPKKYLTSLLRTAEVLAVKELVDVIREFNLKDSEDVRNEEDGTRSKTTITDGCHSSFNDDVAGVSKRKRKRKPVKVTKVMDDEELCGYERYSALEEDEEKVTGDGPRITRRSSMRVMELSRNYAERLAAEGPLRKNLDSRNSEYDSSTACHALYDDDDSESDLDEVVVKRRQKRRLREPKKKRRWKRAIRASMPNSAETSTHANSDDDDFKTSTRDSASKQDTDGNDVQTVTTTSFEANDGEEEDESQEDFQEREDPDSKDKQEEEHKKRWQKEAKNKRQQRRQPRDPQQKSGRKSLREKGQKHSASKEYRKLWRQTRPIMKCAYCTYETRDKTSFSSHVARHDPTAQRFVCEICSKTFRSKKGIRCHRLSHSGPERLHKCTHCEFHTPQKWNWLQHLAVIHKVDPSGNPLSENISCPQCDFVCVANHQLKAHLLRKHTIDKPFKCQQCDYSTVIKHELEKHIGIRHQNERRYMCEACGFRSQTQGGLTRHKRSHTGVKPFKCELCGMCYADRGKLKIHLVRHTSDEKPFVCHVCGHACRRRDNLRMHLKRIHGANLDSEGGGATSRTYSVANQKRDQLVDHTQLHHHSLLVQQLQKPAVDHQAMQLENVQVEHLSVLHSVSSALQCNNAVDSAIRNVREGDCLRESCENDCLPQDGDVASLHVGRDACSLLQAVTGALDCANTNNQMHVVQDAHCSVLRLLPTTVPLS